MNTTDPTKYNPRVRHWPKIITTAVLGTVLILILIYMNLGPAYARECSKGEAVSIAIGQYGAIRSLGVDDVGDYLIVRLLLQGGDIVEVAVYKWGC